MSTTEFNVLKAELVKWVGSLNNASILNLLNSIRLSGAGAGNDWWSELTDEQKENIQLGLDDLTEGRTMSSTEFWEQLKTK